MFKLSLWVGGKRYIFDGRKWIRVTWDGREWVW